MVAVFDFKILTALKGWVGHAPQGRGALQNIYIKERTLNIGNGNYAIQVENLTKRYKGADTAGFVRAEKNR